MSFTKKIKKITERVVRRAKYDDLLYTLLQLSAASLAVANPAVAAVAIYINAIQSKEGEHPKSKLRHSFYHFRKTGLISVESRKGNTCITLTKEGERRARMCGIGRILSDNIELCTTKWDGTWKLVFFDLKNEKNKERDAIRVMLKRCGFVFLQKSVWVYPHDCSTEIDFLRSFFGLNDHEFRLVISSDIGDDSFFRKHFKL